MKVHSLEIQRAASYEQNAGQFVGLCTLVGDTGKQSLTLSPVSISRIFEVIRQDMEATAKLAAKQTGGALADAAAEPLLLTNMTPES